MLSTDALERQLLDALPVTIYAMDLEGTLTSVHESAARFGDESPALALSQSHEPRGRPVWEAVGDALPRDQVERAMALLRAGRTPIVRWEIARGTDDDRRALLAQMTPQHDDAHAVVGFVISAVDLTSTYRAHDAALEAGVALSRTLELDRTCQEAAQQLRRMLRPDLFVLALSDDDGATLRIAYDSGGDGDRRAFELRFAASWRTALETGAIVTTRSDTLLELTAPLLGGTTAKLGAMSVVVDDIASPEKLADARRFLGAIAAHTSTAIARARAAAHAGHRRRIEAIGEVAAGVAHELRNPIFGISSAAQLLRFRSREDPVVESNVGRILREVERLNRMVATLLELGRPVALKLSPGDPDTVLDDVIESERGRFESRAVALRRTRPDHPASAAIDAEQLARVFTSILSNAIDAAPEATDITLQSVVLPSGGWRCRLTNGGAPIAPELLPRVFEPFLSTKPGSSGIGLALAQRIIDDHHGTIGIESTAESGTTVTVALPGA